MDVFDVLHAPWFGANLNGRDEVKKKNFDTAPHDRRSFTRGVKVRPLSRSVKPRPRFSDVRRRARKGPAGAGGAGK
ncbi:MAG TPA: hypothetical protein VER17_05615 [Tepidisphaeraceae bacterium]|nr:hypothetical protein [Tepidisphaeraceae bacterium]